MTQGEIHLVELLKSLSVLLDVNRLDVIAVSLYISIYRMDLAGKIRFFGRNYDHE